MELADYWDDAVFNATNAGKTIASYSTSTHEIDSLGEMRPNDDPEQLKDARVMLAMGRYAFMLRPWLFVFYGRHVVDSLCPARSVSATYSQQ